MIDSMMHIKYLMYIILKNLVMVNMNLSPEVDSNLCSGGCKPNTLTTELHVWCFLTKVISTKNLTTFWLPSCDIVSLKVCFDVVRFNVQCPKMLICCVFCLVDDSISRWEAETVHRQS